MKPSLQPITLPLECASYGDEPFQPLVLPDAGYVVVGGPNALYVVSMKSPPKLVLELPAVDRIAGFAANQGQLYVQDGTVLSRWTLTDAPRCVGAINLVTQKRFPKPGKKTEANEDRAEDPNWDELHALSPALEAKRQRLKGARRRAAWSALLQEGSRLSWAWANEAGNTDTAAFQQVYDLIGTLWKLLGLPETSIMERKQARDAADAELANALLDAGELVLSAPVVRTHAMGGKRGAMVFVLDRTGAVHPLDDQFVLKRTWRGDRPALPALALTEFETSADSDAFACRLYYVDDDGGVSAIDGDASPLAQLHTWPAKPRPCASNVRLRVTDGLVWGSGAQGANLFALPVDRPTEHSRVAVPVRVDDWRWLEIRVDDKLALLSSAMQSELLSYGDGARTPRRWPESNVTPAFATFLPASKFPEKTNGRPLLVLNVDREAQSQTALGFHTLIANTVDAAIPGIAGYPPPPQRLFGGTFDAWSATSPTPRAVLTQPSVSRQDVYLVARTTTASEAMRSLLDPSSNVSWSRIGAELMAHADAATVLETVDVPQHAGSTVFFCYALGNSITSEHASEAWAALGALKKTATPIELTIMRTDHLVIARGDPRREVLGPALARNQSVIVNLGPNTSISGKTDARGVFQVPSLYDGMTVTVSPTLPGEGSYKSSSCQLRHGGENLIQLDITRMK